MVSIPVPRALPLTILALAALLAMKLLMLLGVVPQEALGTLPLFGTSVGVVTAAQAAAPSAEAAPGATDAGAKPEAARPAAEKSEGGTAAPAKAETAAKPADGKPPAAPIAAVAPRPPPAPVLPTTRPSDPPPVTDSERAVLLDLRQRREELDARAAGLDQRAAMIAAAERRLEARVTELTALQTRLEGLDRARKEREESNWRGLVKIYEDMKPRDAATIFNGLDINVLLEVLDRMREARSAPILAAMLPDKARQATADLAQRRLKNNSIGG